MKRAKPRAPTPGNVWARRWLDSVACGANTMSQRKVESIKTRGGGLRSVRKLARERGVHLLLLTDDHGDELVAASKSSFKVIC